MQRRKFLTIVGGGVIVAAGTAAGGFYATREPRKALAAWNRAGSAFDEPRMRALSYAILAPNPHNRQPWMVDLSSRIASSFMSIRRGCCRRQTRSTARSPSASAASSN